MDRDDVLVALTKLDARVDQLSKDSSDIDARVRRIEVATWVMVGSVVGLSALRTLAPHLLAAVFP